MACLPLFASEDLKVPIREGISKICPLDLVQSSFEALRFFLLPRESGTTSLHLLVGLHAASKVHMRLRDVLLCQSHFIPENPVTTLPWLAPHFSAPSAPPGSGTPPHKCTPEEVADLLKARFRPTPIGGKKPKEFRWVITCLTSDHPKDTTPRYSDLAACASLYVAVDILTHHDGIRHSGLEGQSSTTARGLLVLIACGLQQFLHNPRPDHAVDMAALSDLADNFFFSEI
jgi:hypothetical protein